MKTLFSELLSALGKMVGLDDLRPDADNACDLVFDDLPVTMRCIEEREDLLVYCVVGKIADAGPARESQYKRLLEANFLFARTGGTTLGASERGEIVTLQRNYSMRLLESSNFVQALEEFLNIADGWRQELSATADSAPPATEPPGNWSHMTRA